MIALLHLYLLHLTMPVTRRDFISITNFKTEAQTCCNVILGRNGRLWFETWENEGGKITTITPEHQI